MVSPAGTLVTRPLGLSEAVKNSTALWQDDLQHLFNNAKDRFPDVVWEVTDPESNGNNAEEVWGHKAIVYARSPPSFQARYFSFRHPPPASPMPYSGSPTESMNAQSALSLTIAGDYADPSRSPSPYRALSPSPSSTPAPLLRISRTMNPILFQNELEYLYTGKGFGEVFEFLFDTSEKREEGDAEDNRIDKLRKDLVFMWRSRLYSDVRIILTNNDSNETEDLAIFSSHRFVLISRSPYFYSQFVSFNGTMSDLTDVHLPSPPFTPPSLHFTLGFIYTGTLVFSNRSFDLDTAFQIMRSASYLSLDTLYNEIQARIVQDMMHGLFHAFLDFEEYENITGKKWGTGGCKCRQCARRTPRVLEFATAEDVKNPYLERGARRALVGLFGEGWCIPEFASLPQKTKDGLLKGLAKRTTPLNIFPLLFAAQQAINKLSTVLDEWADATRDMVLAARKTIDETLCAQSEVCFEQAEWLELMNADGGRFEDGERVEWIMDSVRRGLSEKSAAVVYQTLVSSILLRPHPEERGETLLSNTSYIRVLVEQTRMDVLRWLRKRWVNVRQEGGFDTLESWSIKEISHEIEVPVDDLLSPPPAQPSRVSATRPGFKSVINRADGESDNLSVHSLRASVLNRNMAKSARNGQTGEKLNSSASSVRSVARSTISTSSRLTTSTAAGSSRQKVTVTRPSRDSLAPPPASDRGSVRSLATSVSEAGASRAPRRSGVGENGARPLSSASSVMSAKSRASTVRKSSTTDVASVSKARSTVSAVSRPASAVSTSTRSEASTAFKTAPDSASRRVSGASTASQLSVHPPIPPVPPVPRIRRPSVASTASAASSVGGARVRKSNTSVTTTETSPRATKTLKPTPPSNRPASVKSARSMTSVRSTVTKKVPSVASAKPPSEKSLPPPPPPRSVAEEHPMEIENTSSSLTVKPIKPAPSTVSSEENRSSTGKTEGTSASTSTTTAKKVKRKESTDTITQVSEKVSRTSDPGNTTITAETPTAATATGTTTTAVAKGATLEIGIPCIVTSKRKKFRAYARYIGEVEGEHGYWVGLEVPIHESFSSEEALIGPQWNDGTWGGVRYFDLGNSASSEWGDDDHHHHHGHHSHHGSSGHHRGMIRRRRDWMTSSSGQKSSMGSMIGSMSLKREGDQLSIDRSKRFRSVSPAMSDVEPSESRGLFVRPQQVLYVVDAVGTDI